MTPLLILYIYLYDIFCKTMQMNSRLITVGVERVAKENWLCPWFPFFSHRNKHPKFQFDSVKIEVRATT